MAFVYIICVYMNRSQVTRCLLRRSAAVLLLVAPIYPRGRKCSARMHGPVRLLSICIYVYIHYSHCFKVDIAGAGPPCVDWSSSGSRQGDQGKSYVCYLAYVRVMHELGLLFALFENSDRFADEALDRNFSPKFTRHSLGVLEPRPGHVGACAVHVRKKMIHVFDFATTLIP